MRFSSRTWYLLSLLFFVAAVWFWLRGNEEIAKRDAAKKKAAPQSNAFPPLQSTRMAPGAPPPRQVAAVAPGVGAGGGAAPAPAPPIGIPSRDRFPYRLRNTDQSLGQLGLSDTAVLLDNAFIDTANPTSPDIPEHLQAVGDPGSYIVQSRGPLSGAFYERLRKTGAEFVSYVPNNAVLVRATEQTARELAGLPQTQAVLRYEPYYKLAQALLPLAVEQEPIPLDRALNVTVYPNQREIALAAFQTLGAEMIAEDRTPFGPLLTIKPRPDSLVALAQLPVVQRIEYANPRVLLNDLTRVRLGVSTNGAVPNNYLDLTGSGVLVNINDTGVEAAHPDLAGRVSSTDTNLSTLQDFNGHGTHVAGTIASSGGKSSTVLNADGSDPMPDFRGMAPEAELFVLPIDLGLGPLISDSYLQESAASTNFTTRSRTNALISNNSWGYANAFEYNASSASYDAAVRDALPGVEGSQPVLYVFAAGNFGEGTTNGTIGLADSIISPATAKNVITVGAIEQRRNIANQYFTTNVVDGTNVVVTNVPFLGITDSDNEVFEFSSRGNVGTGSEGEFGRFKPDLVAPGTFVVSTRSSHWRLENFIRPDSLLLPILSNLNTNLGPYYRYESGTSMAAGAVSGVLALVQEFFEQRLQRGFSPALMKALLINGARTLNANYDLQVRTTLNIQGWGLLHLTNSLPAGWVDTSDEARWPVRFLDQSPTNVLATGERHTWNLEVSTNAQSFPLRVTLVWTDPPGNPSAAIKLVNDLDLVVTNLASGEVYFGNNFPAGFDFTTPNEIDSATETNRDFVNNVENVFLSGARSTNYSITVIGRRVNVNAVTADNTDVVQDYALVISSRNGDVTNAFPSLTREAPATLPLPPLTVITNGVALLNERVGANYQLLASTNGVVDQWRFYVFTNAFFTNDNQSGLTNGSNVAFVTFLPPNISRSRVLEADIDLYVSQNPQLTNLDSAVLQSAWQSRNRGGTELIVLTNAGVGLDQVFYIGVKSEDQQGGEYGIAVFSSDEPFDSQDESGNRILRGVPPNAPIPDGSSSSPGFVPVFAFGIVPAVVARVIVTNAITHQSVGDLLGNLSHEDQFAVLNNHSPFDGQTNGFFSAIYDDSGGSQFFFSRHTDGPGTLNNFIGQLSAGVWLLTMSDDALNNIGSVNGLTIRVEPQSSPTNFISDTVLANQWNYYFVEVPADASRLIVDLQSMSGPLNVYIRRGALPTTTLYDKFALLNPAAGSVSLGLGDVPPLSPGRYFVGVFNPTAIPINYEIRIRIERDASAIEAQTYLPGNQPVLIDDAVVRSTLVVTNKQPVAGVEVGVRIAHARASDLVLHLVDPRGQRVLLAENRGRDSGGGYGVSIITTNVVPRTSSGGPQEDRNLINVGQNFGTLIIDYDFFTIPDTLRVYYDGNRLFDTGITNGANSIRLNFGPGLSTDIEIVVNEGGSPNLTTEWTYTATVITEQMIHTVFTEDTNKAAVPIKFGTAPFASVGGVASALVFSNGFEGAIPADYCAVTNFDAWQVLSNSVTVVSDPTVAHSGTNYLALRDGQVSLDLPTVASRQYRLEYAYRRSPTDPSLVSWWPGEGNAHDLVDGNHGMLTNGISFTNGIVGGAFNFDGVDDYAIVPVSSNLHVRSLTFDAWIFPTDLTQPRPILEYANTNGPSGAHFWIGPSSRPPLFGPGKLFVNFRYDNMPGDVTPYAVVETDSGLIKTGEWQHVAATYDQASGEARLYHNGNVVGATNLGNFLPATTFESLLIGHRPLSSPDGSAGATFAGNIDELDVWNRALAPEEIRAIYLAGNAGKCGAQVREFPMPISWWPGEDNANDVVDSNPGILSPSGVTFAAGLVGRAFSFDGTGEVTINNNTNLNPQTNLTMEAWVFPTTLDGEMESILFKEPDSSVPEQYAMAIKGPLNVSCPAGVITNGHFAFALAGVAGLPDEFCGRVDGGGMVPTNQWTHLAVTFDGSTARAYINGVLSRTITNLSGTVNVSPGPLRIGSRSPTILNVMPQERFNGLIDEVAIYDRALDPCEIHAIYDANALGKYNLRGRPTPCDVTATIVVDDRITNSFTGSFDWQTNRVDFTATEDGTRMALAGQEWEMWFDTFQLSEITTIGNEYLPEEQLKPFVGLSAAGPWTLEVWDNRVGGALTLPRILSWELRFTFAHTNPPAILLTNCIPGTNVVSVYASGCDPLTNCVVGDEIKYFIVDVPRRATRATNILSGTGDLVLLYNPDSLPGILTGDFRFDTNGVGLGETVTLTTNFPPAGELRPGQRYYLGVTATNAAPDATNCFTISVAFDQVDTNLIVVPTLTSGACLTNTIAATKALDYYQFIASSNASTAVFQLLPRNGDVNLVVRKALPVLDPLPLPIVDGFDYLSQNPGTNLDQIVITTNSQPVPLAPGIWYLGVFNNDINPVTYTLCASESTSALYNLVRLTNDVPVNFTIASGSFFTNFFVFTADPTNGFISFSLYNLNNPADLLAALDVFPDTFSLDRASGDPANPAQILVQTNLFVPSLAGEWYLAVDNLGADLSFTILASVTTTNLSTNGIVITPQIDITNNQFCLTWNSVAGHSYYVQAKTNLTDPSWVSISPAIVATNTTAGYCVPMSGPHSFFRVVEGAAPPPGGTMIDPEIVVTNNSVCLSWSSVVGNSYYVEAKSSLSTPTWTVASPTVTATNTTTTYCVTITGSPMFFRIVQGAAPASTGPTIDFTSLMLTPGGFVLSWTASPADRFQVQYATSLPPVWTTFTNIITSTTGDFTFTDDGSQSGGLAGLRFYRLLRLP